MKKILAITLSLTCLFSVIMLSAAAAKQQFEVGKTYVWVERNYKAWENPLLSEFSINGELVNIYQSDTYEKISDYLKPGWNAISVKTTPQVPANKDNHLIFHIGPMVKDPDNPNNYVMYPELWKFDNGTDWDFNDGYYSHPLGPGTKEVTHEYHLYLSDAMREQIGKPLKEGDYLLKVRPKYRRWDTPVIATIAINGTAFSSYTLAPRQIVITDLLKSGKNTIKIASHRVKNIFDKNDLECTILGPAQWSAGQNSFILKPIVEISAMQGWIKDDSTGQLVKTGDPSAEWIERIIPFVVKGIKGTEKPKTDKKPTAQPNMQNTTNI